MAQQIIAFLLLAIAVAYLIKKFLLPKKKKGGKDCGTGDCGCN